ncbi:hypothetical protein BsWGS_24109 [Bradybaena similaris]
MFRRLAPAVAFLVALMAVGTVGNIIVCYMFLRKIRPSSQNSLLLSLGTFDLLSCVVGVPSEIFDIRHYYMYESRVGCKTMRFLTTLPSLASVLVLLVIAADRYRKICKPLHHQIHRCHVRISLAIILAVATILSFPALFVYGHRILQTPITGVIGYDCSISEVYRSKQYHVMYEGMFCALFFVCTVALVLIYAKIWRETKRHIQYMKANAMFGPEFLNDKYNTSSAETYDECASDSRRSSEASYADCKCLYHCYRSFQKKGERKCVLRADVTDALGLMVNSPETPDTRELDKIEDTVLRSNYVSMQLNEHTAGNAESSQIFELESFDNQTAISRDNSLGFSPNGSNVTKCREHEEMNIVEDESAYGPFDDRNPMISNSKGHEKTPDANLHFVETTSTSYGFDNGNPMPSYSKQGDTIPDTCSFSLKSNGERRNADAQNPTFTESKRGENTPESCLYSLKQNLKSLDAEASTEDNTNYDANGYSLSAPASACDVNERLGSEICRVVVSRLNSLDVNINCNDNYPVDMHRLSDPLEQTGIYNSGYTECCSRNNNLVPLQAEETRQTAGSVEHICQTQTCANLPENTLCLNQFCIANHNSPSRRMSYYSETSSLNSNLNVDGLKSKRVSFSKDLEDYEYSSPVICTEEIPKSDFPNKLLRSRSEQSLLAAKRSQKALKSRRTTILAFTITVGFIVSYLPYLILAILRSVIENFGQHLDDAALNIYNLFIRSYFVNNVLNIFVYSYMHLEFRTQLSELWQRLTQSVFKNRALDAKGRQ